MSRNDTSNLQSTIPTFASNYKRLLLKGNINIRTLGNIGVRWDLVHRREWAKWERKKSMAIEDTTKRKIGKHTHCVCTLSRNRYIHSSCWLQCKTVKCPITPWWGLKGWKGVFLVTWGGKFPCSQPWTPPVLNFKTPWVLRHFEI